MLDLHLSSLAPSLTLAYFFKLSIKLSTGETLYIADQQIILSKAAGSILELSPHAPMQTFTTRNILCIRELKENHVTSTSMDSIASCMSLASRQSQLSISSSHLKCK